MSLCRSSTPWSILSNGGVYFDLHANNITTAVVIIPSTVFRYYKVEISPNPWYDCENKHLMSEVLSPRSGSWQVARQSLT